ncbi:MAG: hypothetical protein Q9215_005822 [Flavoplaca cf. flavocitrina]
MPSSKLRHPSFQRRTEDGPMSLPTPMNFQEIQDRLMTCPVSRIHFADENGNQRTDTTTIEQMRTLSHSTRRALFQAWSELRFIISHHESELCKGWLQMSSPQRKKLLAKVCPEVPETHRPDLASLREADRTESAIGNMSQFAMRFRYLNLQDLSKQGPLLWMLDSRSRNFPSIFSSADWNSIRLGLNTKTIKPQYLRGHTMYLNGEWTEDTYGRLVSWEGDRMAILKYYRGIAPDPGMGLTILEIQRDLLRFLVRSSIAILYDIIDTDITKCSLKGISSCSKVHILLEEDDRMSPKSSITDYQSPAVRVFEEPYHAPDPFDFRKTRKLVNAKYREAQDYLLLIREDPCFFREVISEACTSTKEAHIKHMTEPTYESLTDCARHEAVATALSRLYRQACWWETVCRLLDNLMTIPENLKDSIQPGQLLPTIFLEAMTPLEHFLDDGISAWIRRLSWQLSELSTFKQYTMYKAVMDGPKGKYITTYVRKHPANNPRLTDDTLYWLLMELITGDATLVERCDPAEIVGEIEVLISSDPLERGRLTSNTMSLISAAAAALEVRRQIHSSMCKEYSICPWSDEEISVWMENNAAPFTEIYNFFHKDMKFDSLVTNLDVFEYTSDKRPNAISTAHMRRAEKALDAFWGKVNAEFTRKTGRSIEVVEIDRSYYKDLRRTPPWVPKEAIQRDDTTQENLDYKHVLATLVERTEKTLEQSRSIATREKTKTRRQQNDHNQHDNTISTLPTIESPEPNLAGTTSFEAPHLTVKRRVYNTFAALFGKPVADTLPGELPWKHFKKAMVNAGFAVEKQQGSAWLFASERGNIIFHEPHPESKLPMQWARRIARRLNRNFGWTMDTFVVDGDGDDEMTAKICEDNDVIVA